MALLEGDIAKAIFAGFRGKLLKGALTRTVPGGGLDEHGDPVASTVVSFPCEGFVENFSAFYRAQAGIPDTDVKVLIFAQSIATVPTKDDVVIFRGTRYQIRRVLEIDPAVATYQLQGYRTAVSAAPTYDPDAEALFARFTTPPTDDRKGLINTLIVSLKAAGVWTKLDALYVLAAHDAQAARLNWKADIYNATAFNSPTFMVDRGYQGDGTSNYLNTGFTPASAGNISRLNAHLGAFVVGGDATGTHTDAGYSNGTVDGRRAAVVDSIRVRSHSANVYMEPDSGDSLGWTCWARQNDTDVEVSRNATHVSAASATASNPSNTLAILCREAVNPTEYSPRQVGAAHVGVYITEAEREALYSILLNYMTSVGAA